MRKPKEIIIKNKTLEQILKEHEDLLNEGVCVDLSDADLKYVDLEWTDLRCANLEGANLEGAYLEGADLDGANLRHANLQYANLEGADLEGADLEGANLKYANLQYADLERADLKDANLEGINLGYANLEYTYLAGAHLGRAYLKYANLQYTDLEGANLEGANLRGARGSLIKYRKGKILTEDIIGYKKCEHGVIVTLLIPRGAIVFSINGNKCRTNRAKVIAIDGADRAYSRYNNMSYYVGDEFTIYNFNCEYNMECSEGIHFFMTKEEAEKY